MSELSNTIDRKLHKWHLLAVPILLAIICGCSPTQSTITQDVTFTPPPSETPTSTLTPTETFTQTPTPTPRLITFYGSGANGSETQAVAIHATADFYKNNPDSLQESRNKLPQTLNESIMELAYENGYRKCGATLIDLRPFNDDNYLATVATASHCLPNFTNEESINIQLPEFYKLPEHGNNIFTTTTFYHSMVFAPESGQPEDVGFVAFLVPKNTSFPFKPLGLNNFGTGEPLIYNQTYYTRPYPLGFEMPQEVTFMGFTQSSSYMFPSKDGRRLIFQTTDAVSFGASGSIIVDKHGQVVAIWGAQTPFSNFAEASLVDPHVHYWLNTFIKFAFDSFQITQSPSRPQNSRIYIPF